jgi:hypothetical protein
LLEAFDRFLYSKTKTPIWIAANTIQHIPTIDRVALNAFEQNPAMREKNTTKHPRLMQAVIRLGLGISIIWLDIDATVVLLAIEKV